MSRMPVVYLPHGGGPWPFVDMGMPRRGFDELAEFLRSVPGLAPIPPRALLAVSAHWEAPVPTVSSSPRPPMLYDYGGFPPEAYALSWPAPGDPELAAEVRNLLEAAGLPTAEDPQRGFDHGTFVPLKVAWPDAEVPTVQLSLQRGLDPQTHLAIGRAIAPLRDEGVFVIGSGMSYHDLRAFLDPRAAEVADTFDAWLTDAATAEPAERDRRLAAWESAPMARRAHPREEHLLPLMVVAGAAGDDRGRKVFGGPFVVARVSAFAFG